MSFSQKVASFRVNFFMLMQFLYGLLCPDNIQHFSFFSSLKQSSSRKEPKVLLLITLAVGFLAFISSGQSEEHHK